ncbi:hypothetical protein FA95DRAFT_1169385 [Auriscalpium vulgare]|uniref:Uncharacterized protein n=1 Tax=Auriscalpium vulgare TaxID=40419 RepID=A0ACB8SAA3_9AGAM|nr:hypothetical protein FA95DRAFT_1169385 [Auriscalpium vulgare]
MSSFGISTCTWHKCQITFTGLGVTLTFNNPDTRELTQELLDRPDGLECCMLRRGSGSSRELGYRNGTTLQHCARTIASAEHRRDAGHISCLRESEARRIGSFLAALVLRTQSSKHEVLMSQPTLPGWAKALHESVSCRQRARREFAAPRSAYGPGEGYGTTVSLARQLGCTLCVRVTILCLPHRRGYIGVP